MSSPFVAQADSKKGHWCVNSKVCCISVTQHNGVSQIIA